MQLMHCAKVENFQKKLFTLFLSGFKLDLTVLKCQMISIYYLTEFGWQMECVDSLID